MSLNHESNNTKFDIKPPKYICCERILICVWTVICITIPINFPKHHLNIVTFSKGYSEKIMSLSQLILNRFLFILSYLNATVGIDYEMLQGRQLGILSINFTTGLAFSSRRNWRSRHGTSLVVQWLRFCTSNAGDEGSIPGWGTKIPHALWPKRKKKQNQGGN